MLVDMNSWQIFKPWHWWLKLDQKRIAYLANLLPESLSLDTGYRGPEFDSREFIGWSGWLTHCTRIHFGGVVGGIFPIRFFG